MQDYIFPSEIGSRRLISMASFEHIASILGGLAAAYEVTRLSITAAKDRVTFPWRLVERWVDQLYAALRAAHVVPDVIVGVGRGGAVVAGMISTKYRDDPHHTGLVIPIASIDRVYVGEGPVIVGVHNLDVHAKRVLLLNADSYSGITLYRARQVLDYAEPAEIKTGSLITFTDVEEPPDFFGARLPLRLANRHLPWRSKEPRETKTSLGDRRFLVVLTGLVATGKTSVANSLVKQLAFHPIYSDWYWFTHGLHDRANNPLTSQKHNDHMSSLCWSALATGRNVVLDSTSRWRTRRDQLQSQAARYGINTIFVRCHCSEEEASRRIRERKHIGPHDFGTQFEYGRVKGEYQDIDAHELKSRNLIDVDTEGLECEMSNVSSTAPESDVAFEMSQIVAAIRGYYFSRVVAGEVSNE